MGKNELIQYMENTKSEIMRSNKMSYVISTRINRMFLLLRNYSDTNSKNDLREYVAAHISDTTHGYGQDTSFEKGKMIAIIDRALELL